MEPGPGVMGRGSSATSLPCTLGREVEVEVVLRRRGTAGGVYKCVSGIWRKRHVVVFEGDGKDCVLSRLSSAGVCGFAGLQ